MNVCYTLSFWGFSGVLCFCAYDYLRVHVSTMAYPVGGDSAELSLLGAGLGTMAISGAAICALPLMGVTSALGYHALIVMYYTIGHPLARMSLLCVTVRGLLAMGKESHCRLGLLMGVFIASESIFPILTELIASFFE